MLRKIWLIPPQDIGWATTDEEVKEGHAGETLETANDRAAGNTFRPNIYASGSNLKHGVRVVAGYSDHVVLFSIPPDVFHGFTETHAKKGHSTATPVPTLPSAPGIPPQPEIPDHYEAVQITGCYVDMVPRLIDLAVDSGTAMAVYAFSASGQVRVYQLEKTHATSDANGVSRMTASRNGRLVMDRPGVEV